MSSRPAAWLSPSAFVSRRLAWSMTLLTIALSASLCGRAAETPDPAGLPDLPGLEQDVSLRRGLQNSAIKFATQKTGLVAYLGGSITHNPGWTQLVDQELKRRFPETQFTFVRAGIPSVDSTGHAFRFERDVLQQGIPDLLFVEAAVNDLHNSRSAVEALRGFEGIVRRARRANRAIDVVALHFADPKHSAELAAGRTPAVIASHERVAERYEIPSVNLASEVQRRIAAGQFVWERDFRDVHPSPFGQRLYFQAIKRLFDKAWREPVPVEAATVERAMPAALDPFSYDAGQLVSPSRVRSAAGFKLERRWRPADKAGVREGFVDVDMFVGEQPNSTLSFAFEGRAVGLFLVAGPDAATLEYRVDGRDWKTQDTFTPWSSGLHIPWALMLESELADAPHVLELRIASSHNSRSKGASLRIRDVLVNGPRLDLPPLGEFQTKSSLDGEIQQVRSWAPESAVRAPTPLLVYLHSWSSDYRQDNAAWQREAVRREWIYVHPNFRGVNRTPTACGSKFARQDVLDAVEHVAANYQVDRERIYLAGTSGGGHMTMLMAAYHPDRFSAASSWVGISDLAEWYRFHVKNGQPDHYARMTMQALGGAPGASPVVEREYRERSPLEWLPRAVDLPLDLAAGITDGHSGSVPVAHSLRAFNAVARAAGGAAVSDGEMDELWRLRRLSSPKPGDEQFDESFGRATYLRREAGRARVTIFEGGHEGLAGAACDWLAKQRRLVELAPPR